MSRSISFTGGKKYSSCKLNATARDLAVRVEKGCPGEARAGLFLPVRRPAKSRAVAICRQAGEPQGRARSAWNGGEPTGRQVSRAAGKPGHWIKPWV
ncbi:hypothetical protein [Mucilaginibacter sp.]|uniref:hypothetical protein n=1 Tax=Mucilaginibacter sp. TaxID=1882438 RepID=UPI00261A2CF1|nr:hypothetical protein [Mucilaginibacter sp.]